MHTEESQSPRRAGLRTGGFLLLAAAVLTPFTSILGRLMPSRENTIIDELPADLLTLVVVGLAAVGTARVTFALLATRKNTQIARPSETDLLERTHEEQRELRD